MFDHPELVDFAIGLVNSVVNSPEGEGSFGGNSDYRRAVINPIHQNFFGVTGSRNDCWDSTC